MKEHMFSLTKKDFDMQTFRSGGKGGQHQNKTNSGVRIVHRDSGAVGECRETRSQHKNKSIAFKRLTETKEFKQWCKIRVGEIVTGETLDEKINRLMKEENLKIEGKNAKGKWEVI